MLSSSPEELSKASAVMAAQKAELRLRPTLKSFYIYYTEHNIDILPLMEYKMQNLLIEIISRLKLVNQEIDRYRFYFEKTFDPKSCALNEEILNNNLDNSINIISRELIRIADKIIELLLLIQESEFNEPAVILKRIILKLNDFIKKRRV